MFSTRAIFLTVTALVCAGGCATRITPPPSPINPVAVYVTDYGRHSSILLPTGDGHLVEYSYGDWEYYALNKYRWYIGASKLIYSDASGLGRRVLAHPGDHQALHKFLGSKRLLHLYVEQSRVRDLLAELDTRYNQRLDTMIYNDYVKAYFVKDNSRYWFFNTCNAQTALWLKKLDCQVDGLAVMSNFQLAAPKAEVVARGRRVEDQPINGSRGYADPVQLSQQPPGNGNGNSKW
jgi:hypothetical protein